MDESVFSFACVQVATSRQVIPLAPSRSQAGANPAAVRCLSARCDRRARRRAPPKCAHTSRTSSDSKSSSPRYSLRWGRSVRSADRRRRNNHTRGRVETTWRRYRRALGRFAGASGRTRGLFQYGLLHFKFGHTLGGVACRGTHVCPHRLHSHMVNVTVFVIFGMLLWSVSQRLRTVYLLAYIYLAK